jgi:putative addiction module component (TIGR02574 family)
MSTPILEDILQLSVSERIRLVEEISDTIVDAPEQLPLTEAQRDEIDRRIEEYRRNPEAGAAWRQVLDRMKASDETR